MRQGEGECTQQIELIDANSTVIWTPDDDQPCNATLLGIRNEVLLAHVGPLHGTFGVSRSSEADGTESDPGRRQSVSPGALRAVVGVGRGAHVTVASSVERHVDRMMRAEV